MDALHPFWFARGQFSEARRWIDLALARQGGPPTAVRVKALCNHGVMAGFQGDLDAGWSRLAEARKLAQQMRDTDTHSLILYSEGNLALYSGEPERAMASYDSALEWLRSEANQMRLFESLIGFGLASWMLHDTARSVAFHEELLELTRRLGDSVYQTYSLWGSRWWCGAKATTIAQCTFSRRVCGSRIAWTTPSARRCASKRWPGLQLASTKRTVPLDSWAPQGRSANLLVD